MGYKSEIMAAEKTPVDDLEQLRGMAPSLLDMKQSNVCRICTKTNQPGTISFFSRAAIKENILQNVKKLSNIIISSSDNLPHSICGQCQIQLTSAVQFKNLCDSSEKKMKSLLAEPPRIPSTASISHCSDLDEQEQDVDSGTGTQNSRADFICRKCHVVLDNEHEYRKHIRTQEHKMNLWSCNRCGKTYTLRSNYAHHMIRHRRQILADTPFICELCEKRFTSAIRLRKHSKSHNKAFAFNCVFCGYETQDRLRFKVHTKGHLNTYKGNSQKSQANRSITPELKSSDRPLKITDNTSISLRPADGSKLWTRLSPIPESGSRDLALYSCSICRVKFVSHNNLSAHLYKAHKVLQKYDCPDCGLSKPSKEDYAKHRLIFHGKTD